MESLKTPQSALQSAADKALQGGEVVVPGTAVNPPPSGVRPNVTSGDKDNAKGNIAEPVGNKDGKGNSANQPAVGAGARPKSEPAQS